ACGPRLPDTCARGLNWANTTENEAYAFYYSPKKRSHVFRRRWSGAESAGVHPPVSDGMVPLRFAALVVWVPDAWGCQPLLRFQGVLHRRISLPDQPVQPVRSWSSASGAGYEGQPRREGTALFPSRL